MLKKIIKKYLDYRGWSTNRKLVLFEVDDYGWSNYFDEDKIKYPDDLGIPPFVQYDRIATSDDLDRLYNVLCSVKDKNGQSAVFSPMTVTGNPDYRKIKDSDFTEYFSEPFTETFERNYGSKLLDKWNEGINAGVFMPEYHGREHLHVSSWLNALSAPNSKTRKAFDAGVYTFADDGEKVLNRKFGAAYSFAHKSEIPFLKESLKEGVDFYRDALKHTPSSFTPPAGGYSYDYDSLLTGLGLKAVSLGKATQITSRSGSNKRKFHYLGQQSKSKMSYIPRNCLFEPHSKKSDAVNRCMRDIESAFDRKKPAIISSHRINFVNDDSGYNGNGLLKLEKLLSKTIEKFPDVEFISTRALIKIMEPLR